MPLTGPLLPTSGIKGYEKNEALLGVFNMFEKTTISNVLLLMSSFMRKQQQTTTTVEILKVSVTLSFIVFWTIWRGNAQCGYTTTPATALVQSLDIPGITITCCLQLTGELGLQQVTLPPSSSCNIGLYSQVTITIIDTYYHKG